MVRMSIDAVGVCTIKVLHGASPMDERSAILIRVPPRLKAQLVAIASKEERSVTKIVEMILRERFAESDSSDDVFSTLEFNP